MDTGITTGTVGKSINLITEIGVAEQTITLVTGIEAPTVPTTVNLITEIGVAEQPITLVTGIEASTAPNAAFLNTEIDTTGAITLSHDLSTQGSATVNVTMDTVGTTALQGEYTFDGTQALAGAFTSTEGSVVIQGTFNMQYQLQTYRVYTWTQIGDFVEYEGAIPGGVAVPGDAQTEIRQRLITITEAFSTLSWIENDVPETLRAQTSNGVDLQPHSQIDATVEFKKSELEAPGIYNLTGDPYLQIRCKEIEQHLFRTRAYEKYNAGLAKVQLGIFGYGNERFDYSSFPPREFHPIGKLTKMTLRFERPNGQLYDFKGLDHNITIVIRYWVIKKAQFNTQILNPAYNPNLLEYENANFRKI